MQKQNPFDDFIMVDWSAKSEQSPLKPEKSENSVWLARIGYSRHYRTRHAFYIDMLDILYESIEKKKRILCGFDFCFGLPHGAVTQMRKATKDTSTVHNWYWLWHYLHENIEDDEENKNNRWEVASKMNYLISGGSCPFWGYPSNAKLPQPKYLKTTKPKVEGSKENSVIVCGDKKFKERRMTEGKNMGQSVWKLFGDASVVGSQSLLGMALLYKLRFMSEYESNIRVYPFENCDTAPVVFAESYYGRTELGIDNNVIPKDKGQVEAAVRFCQEKQKRGELAKLLCRPDNEIILQDEGWTFTEPKPDHIKCL